MAKRTQALQTAQINRNQIRFALLGVGLGGAVPSLIVGPFVTRDGSFLVGPHLLFSPADWYGFGEWGCGAGFILAVVGILWGGKWTNTLMLSAGALCVLSLEAFVISTGGPILSVFSFYYLYIPVVVGITFPRSLTVWTAVVCWIMCITALLLTWDQITWRASAQLMGTSLHSIVYAIIFSVQMFVTIAMIYLGQGDQGVIPVESRSINERPT